MASIFLSRCDCRFDRPLKIQGVRAVTRSIAKVLKREGPQSGPETVARLRAELPPAAQNADLIVRAGSAPTVLAQIAAERGSDLLVTGVARYNGIGDYLLVTAVDHLDRNAQPPTLVLRFHATGPYKGVCIATHS